MDENMDITLEVAQARLDSGEDYIDFEIVTDKVVRVFASIFDITIDKEYTFHCNDTEFPEDIAVHLSNLLNQAWSESGVELLPVM